MFYYNLYVKKLRSQEHYIIYFDIYFNFIVSGRVNNSTLLSELIYTLSNLLVFYNDYIISKNRQLKTFKAGDKLKIWLSVLEYCEVFIEVTSRNLWGEKGKWIVIVLVQLIK